MESLRSFLLMALILVFYFMYQAWVDDNRQQEITRPAPEIPQPANVTDADEVPDLKPSETVHTTGDATSPTTEIETQRGQRVTVVTKLLRLVIDTRGADIKQVDLLDYPVGKKNSDVVVRLMSEELGKMRVLQSGLRGLKDSAAPDHTAHYSTNATHYQSNGNGEVVVRFTWRDTTGLVIEKIYTFRDNSYEIELEYLIRNESNRDWRGYSYAQLKTHYQTPERSMFNPESFSYFGPAMYDGARYDKLDVSDVLDEPLTLTASGGWAAMLQHYFVSALLPPLDVSVQYYALARNLDDYRIGFVTPAITVASGGESGFQSRLFVGPKLQDVLDDVAPGLELAVDYGVLTIFSKPLFWLMSFIYSIIGNWGWAIVILTFSIKLLFYKPSEISGRSMAKMRKVQPRIQALRERYADDRQKLNMATMELYKNEKINPASGCLPILIQLPVFLALYWVLLESVELRQAPFVLWLQDLSVRDPYYVLPLIMGGAMWVQQKLNVTPPDPIQARVLMMMPVMMIAFSAVMPAGLVLYWSVNTVLSVAQQWHINRVIEGKPKKRT